jgi:tetratricopeptide (TPR) repeat protein
MKTVKIASYKPLPILVLGVLIFFLFGPIIGFDFIAIDDGGQILENEKIHRLTLDNVLEIFSSATVSMYQPLTSLFFALIIGVFGFKTAAAFHVGSILIHVLNTCLVYALSQRLFQKKINPLLLASLFAFHPLSVEAVAWISATSSLLFTSFFLLGILQYDQYLEHGQKKNYRASILVFLLGCFCKIQMLPFVGVLFLLDYLRGKRVFQKETVYSKIPFVFIAFIFTCVALQFRKDQTAFVGDYNPFLLVPSQIAWYGMKAFFPLNLSIVYDWPTVLFSKAFVALNVGFIALGFLIFRNRRNPLFLFGSLFYLANIILHTTLFTRFLGPYADRYGYLSILGIWIAAFSLVGQKRVKTLHIVGSLVVAVFFLVARQQTTHWKDTISLWSKNLEHQTSSFSNGMRGQLYFEKGMYAAAQRDFEIIEQDPDPRFEPEKYGYLYSALGLMTTESDGVKSAEYFDRAAQFDPSPSNLENAGLAYQKIQSFEKAESFYLRCAEMSSTPKCFSSLSALYFELEQFEKGEDITTKAITSGHKTLIFYKMRCFFRIQTRQMELAQADYREAQKLFIQSDSKIPDPILTSLGQMLQVTP